MEWLNSHIEYWHWLVLGLLLIATEMFAPSFVMIWFGASAVAVGLILAVIDISVPLQLLIWAGLSLFDLFVWFKFVHPRMKDRSLSGMSREQLIGQEGMVIKVGQDGHGTLRFPVPVLGSDEWTFICRGMISVGDRVFVEELSGNSLIVKAQQSKGE